MNNQKVFEQIAREYSFLDDYEKHIKQPKHNSNKRNIEPKSEKNSFDENEKKYMNNYPEHKIEEIRDEQIDELNQARDNFNRTRYGKFVNKDLDPKRLNDLDYLYDTLEVNRNIKSTQEMNEQSDSQAFKDALEVIKKFEYRFYAFMNKEFNIINKKMIKCSMMCYDNPRMFTVNEAKLCAESCHKNIKEASKFVENLQEKKRTKLAGCIENAKDFKSENAGNDKIVSFLKCYDNLIEDFNEMEKEIKKEFSYYI